MTSAVYGTDMVGREALCSGHLTVTVTTDLRALPGVKTFCEQAEDFHKTLQYQYLCQLKEVYIHHYCMLLTKFTLCGSDCKNKIKLTTDWQLITIDLMLLPMTCNQTEFTDLCN